MLVNMIIMVSSLLKRCSQLFWEANHYVQNKRHATAQASDKNRGRYRVFLAMFPFQGVWKLHSEARASGSGLNDSYTWAWPYLQCMIYGQFISLSSTSKSINKTREHLGIETKVGFWKSQGRCAKENKNIFFYHINAIKSMKLNIIPTGPGCCKIQYSVSY